MDTAEDEDDRHILAAPAAKITPGAAHKLDLANKSRRTKRSSAASKGKAKAAKPAKPAKPTKATTKAPRALKMTPKCIASRFYHSVRAAALQRDAWDDDNKEKARMIHRNILGKFEDMGENDEVPTDDPRYKQYAATSA